MSTPTEDDMAFMERIAEEANMSPCECERLYHAFSCIGKVDELAAENERLREALGRVDRLIGMNEDDDSIEAMGIIAHALRNAGEEEG